MKIQPSRSEKMPLENLVDSGSEEQDDSNTSMDTIEIKYGGIVYHVHIEDQSSYRPRDELCDLVYHLAQVAANRAQEWEETNVSIENILEDSEEVDIVEREVY